MPTFCAISFILICDLRTAASHALGDCRWGAEQELAPCSMSSLHHNIVGFWSVPMSVCDLVPRIAFYRHSMHDSCHQHPREAGRSRPVDQNECGPRLQEHMYAESADECKKEFMQPAYSSYADTTAGLTGLALVTKWGWYKCTWGRRLRRRNHLTSKGFCCAIVLVLLRCWAPCDVTRGSCPPRAHAVLLYEPDQRPGLLAGQGLVTRKLPALPPYCPTFITTGLQPPLDSAVPAGGKCFRRVT